MHAAGIARGLQDATAGHRLGTGRSQHDGQRLRLAAPEGIEHLLHLALAQPGGRHHQLIGQDLADRPTPVRLAGGRIGHQAEQGIDRHQAQHHQRSQADGDATDGVERPQAGHHGALSCRGHRSEKETDMV